jgi:glycosyltransferase involved in cell wall biosynthesis
MKVVFVTTQERGGPVDLTLALMRELRLRPEPVDVVLVGPPPDRATPDLHAAITPVSVPSKFDVAGFRRLRGVLASLRPDVVHAQDRRAALAIAAMPARGRPVVATYHGLPNEGAGKFVDDGPLAGRRPTAGAAATLLGDAVVARRCRAIVAPSERMATFLRQVLRVPSPRIVTIPNGIPIGPIPPASEPEPLTFVSVGVFSPPKAIPMLIEAFATVRAHHPDARLSLVGDGPERAHCEDVVHRLGLGGAVTFEGFHDDVSPFLRPGRVFVLPSVNENFPLALIEAMAAGMACVASRVGGVPEVVGDAGLLVAPGDVGALASELTSLAGDEQRRLDLGRRARERAASAFTIRQCADRHVELWERVAR